MNLILVHLFSTLKCLQINLAYCALNLWKFTKPNLTTLKRNLPMVHCKVEEKTTVVVLIGIIINISVLGWKESREGPSLGRWLAREGENATNHNDNNQMFGVLKEKEISKSLKSFLCSHYWSILSHLVSSQRHFFIQSTKTGLRSNTNNIKERM